jgi:hypothetical protein
LEGENPRFDGALRSPSFHVREEGIGVRQCSRLGGSVGRKMGCARGWHGSFIRRLWLPWVQRPLDGLHLRTRKGSHRVGVGPLECNSQCGHFSRVVCFRRLTLFRGRPGDSGCSQPVTRFGLLLWAGEPTPLPSFVGRGQGDGTWRRRDAFLMNPLLSSASCAKERSGEYKVQQQRASTARPVSDRASLLLS